MGTRGEQARRHQQAVVGGQRAEQLGDGEEDHQRDDHRALRPAGGGDGDDRPANGDADCIGGNEEAGRRDGDAEIGSERGQDAGNDELSRADGEGSERQGIDGYRHGFLRKEADRIMASQAMQVQCKSFRCYFGRRHECAKLSQYQGIGGGPMAISSDTRKRWAWITGLRGLLMLLAGIYAVIFPAQALFVLVIFGGALLLVDGLLGLWSLTFGGAKTGNYWFDVIHNVLAIITGGLILISPVFATLLTTTFLIYLVAFQAIFVGVMEIWVIVRSVSTMPGSGRWCCRACSMCCSALRCCSHRCWARW